MRSSQCVPQWKIRALSLSHSYRKESSGRERNRSYRITLNSQGRIDTESTGLGRIPYSVSRDSKINKWFRSERSSLLYQSISQSVSHSRTRTTHRTRKEVRDAVDIFNKRHRNSVRQHVSATLSVRRTQKLRAGKKKIVNLFHKLMVDFSIGSEV